MGVDIHGWVEFRPDWYESVRMAGRRRAQWAAVVNVGAGLVGRDSFLFDHLFGVFMAPGVVPVAAARGIPDDAAEETEADYLAWADLDGAEQTTWISWPELKAIEWQSVFPDRSRPNEDWQLLFQIMDLLSGRYGEDRVRLVVWFDR